MHVGPLYQFVQSAHFLAHCQATHLNHALLHLVASNESTAMAEDGAFQASDSIQTCIPEPSPSLWQAQSKVSNKLVQYLGYDNIYVLIF